MATLELLNKGTNQKDVSKPDLCYPCSIPYFAPRGKVPKPPRIVPPFSLQAHRQKNVMVEQFKQKSMIKPYPVGNTFFKKYYLRGDFPIALEYDNKGYKIGWKVKFKDLDYRYYLPMFFNGLCETEFPYQYFAQQGILDMLTHGKRKILPVLPRIVTPLKNALNTRNRIVIAAALKCIQALVKSSDAVGEALVPYYRRLLPPLNIYRNLNVNIGDEIDYGQQKKENIGELVQETLELLEVFGGKHAFINIKYFIPTYESCIKNY